MNAVTPSTPPTPADGVPVVGPSDDSVVARMRAMTSARLLGVVESIDRMVSPSRAHRLTLTAALAVLEDRHPDLDAALLVRFADVDRGGLSYASVVLEEARRLGIGAR